LRNYPLLSYYFYISSLCNTPSPCKAISLPITSSSQYIHSSSSPPPLYKSAITAPTRPNIPTPTFTLPAALFPVADVAVAPPVPVPLGVELPVTVSLVVFAPPVLALVFTVELPVNIVNPETEDAVVEAAADETVFVETTEN
jgi:hypothetical protein